MTDQTGPASMPAAPLKAHGLVAALFGVFLAVVGVVTGVHAQRARTGDLFVAVEAAAPSVSATEADAAVLRERFVGVDFALLDDARLSAGSAGAAPTLLRLHLFDDDLLSAVVDRTGPTSAGYWLSGAITEPVSGELTVVVNGRTIAGTVWSYSGRLYKIRTVDNGNILIRQVEASTLLHEMPIHGGSARRPGREPADPVQPITVPRSTGRVRAVTVPRLIRGATDRSEPLGGAEDGARIDLLSVYTPTATELYGGHDAIRAEIDLAVAEANLAYANSGVIQRLNLVFATEVDYVPHDDGSVNLQRLQDPDDGHLDEVHALRDQYAADMVTLEPGGTHIQGAAFDVMQEPSMDFASRAFSSHGIGGFAFAHEFGHLQGLSHDRYQVTQETSEDLSEHKPHPYSFGYVNQAALETGAPTGKKWYTIMAYPAQLQDAGVGAASGVSRMRFSNPDQTYNGDPLGCAGRRTLVEHHGAGGRATHAERDARGRRQLPRRPLPEGRRSRSPAGEQRPVLFGREQRRRYRSSGSGRGRRVGDVQPARRQRRLPGSRRSGVVLHIRWLLPEHRLQQLAVHRGRQLDH